MFDITDARRTALNSEKETGRETATDREQEIGVCC